MKNLVIKMILAVLFIGATVSVNAQNVYVTTNGKKYHEKGCQYLKKSKDVKEVDKAKAEKDGYTACGSCYKKDKKKDDTKKNDGKKNDGKKNDGKKNDGKKDDSKKDDGKTNGGK